MKKITPNAQNIINLLQDNQARSVDEIVQALAERGITQTLASVRSTLSSSQYKEVVFKSEKKPNYVKEVFENYFTLNDNYKVAESEGQ